MALFGGYNNMRAVTDPSYAWDTAATQAVINQLDSINRQLEELRLFLAEDFGGVLVALYRLIEERMPAE